MTAPPAQSDDEISLLDILVVLAENFWLLLLVPLAIGAITFGIASFLHKTYESTAILQPRTVYDEFGKAMGETSAAMLARLRSPKVQRVAARNEKWITNRNYDETQIQVLLQESIDARVDQRSGLVTLTIYAPNPEDARSLAESIISAYVQAALPQGTARQQIDERIAVAKNALAVLDPAIKVILDVDPETGRVKSDLANQPASRPALADLVAQKTANETLIRNLQNSLVASMQDIVIQEPTLDVKPVSPKRLQLTAIAVILSALALTVFAVIHAALRAAAHDPEGSAKITRIRQSILRC